MVSVATSLHLILCTYSPGVMYAVVGIDLRLIGQTEASGYSAFNHSHGMLHSYCFHHTDIIIIVIVVAETSALLQILRRRCTSKI